MFDPAIGLRMASSFTDIALAGMKANLGLWSMGRQLMLGCSEAPLRPASRTSATAFNPFSPAVWSSSPRSVPALPDLSSPLAFWQAWFRCNDLASETCRAVAPAWPSFSSGAAGSGHASNMMAEIPRVYVGFQPGHNSPLWPWGREGMLTMAVTIPPAIEALMRRFGPLQLTT